MKGKLALPSMAVWGNGKPQQALRYSLGVPFCSLDSFGVLDVFIDVLVSARQDLDKKPALRDMFLPKGYPHTALWQNTRSDMSRFSSPFSLFFLFPLHKHHNFVGELNPVLIYKPIFGG